MRLLKRNDFSIIELIINAVGIDKRKDAITPMNATSRFSILKMLKIANLFVPITDKIALSFLFCVKLEYEVIMIIKTAPTRAITTNTIREVEMISVID